MKDGGGQIDPSLRPQKKLSLIRVKNPIKFTCKKKKKHAKFFKSTMVIETVLSSSFHRTYVLKLRKSMYYDQQKPSIVYYRKFKYFCNDTFMKDARTSLSKLHSEQNLPFKT